MYAPRRHFLEQQDTAGRPLSALSCDSSDFQVCWCITPVVNKCCEMVELLQWELTLVPPPCLTIHVAIIQCGARVGTGGGSLRGFLSENAWPMHLPYVE